MIDSALLLADLKRQLKAIETDLRERAEDPDNAWGVRLREQHIAAQGNARTGLSWIDWRNGEVSQAAVGWIIATVFIRFAEDNGLLAGALSDGLPIALPWIAAPGDGLERAVENEQAFYAASPAETSRDWLQRAFRALADLPAGRPLVDPSHSPVWHSPISAAAADALLAFFRRTTPAGDLVHDFSDAELGTRFLGDLYQDLSDYAKKNFALLQTPIFVEEFILDQTLTPAIAEFGLTGLKVIDPACGSGHFLLGSFDRLVAAWAEAAPGVDKGERVQRALDSIHGVDLNPFAIAIARFRLTVSAIKAAGIPTLTSAPAFRYHLAIGDSLLGGVTTNDMFDLGDGEYYEYDAEDLNEYSGILAENQYHVVVANPPYIQPPDAQLRDRYRALYPTCHGKYALSVPFMELLFRLAKRANGGGAGYVGQITSNSFMKREFGKKLIEQFLSGNYTGTSPDYVDLSHILDTSGAYIPGHGTPTVILIGRPRKPQLDTVRAVLGVRGEPGQPADPAQGLAWRDMVDHLEQPGYDGPFVSVADLPRSTYATFPWSLSGGGAGDVKEALYKIGVKKLVIEVAEIGIVTVLGEESPFEVPQKFDGPTTGLVLGDMVRDWSLDSTPRFWPYDSNLEPDASAAKSEWIWPYKANLRNVIFFGKKPAQRGMEWYQYGFLATSKVQTPLTITFAFVATHNHFVLDRGGKVFKHSAPVIKLPEGATEGDHFKLLGVLNSSVACFWLKQVSFNKGDSTDTHGARVTGDPAFDTFEFTATKLAEFPLPAQRSAQLAQRIDEVARKRAACSPAASIEVHVPGLLEQSRQAWLDLGRELVALQEELDWRMYVAYGLADESLLATVDTDSLEPIEPTERVFEIALARQLAAGTTDTAWFTRHGRTPVTEIPSHWAAETRALAERRLAAIESNPALRLLERPEYKRRWAGPSWEQLLGEAARAALLDQLEDSALWQDSAGRPLARSAAQIADELRNDERFRELLAISTGTADYDLTTEVGKLLAAEAVPAYAPLRYKPSGIEKFHAWQHTWDLQRAEDRGEHVTVPVPPKYGPTDFLKTTYWSARGKLDVPKERFIALPGTRLPDDPTEVFGWAGWNHADRGLALARLGNDLSQAGATAEQLTPVLGALIELEPWLDQWHTELDARTGVSPATAISSMITTLLGRLDTGRDTILNWRPAVPTRGRSRTS